MMAEASGDAIVKSEHGDSQVDISSSARPLYAPGLRNGRAYGEGLGIRSFQPSLQEHALGISSPNKTSTISVQPVDVPAMPATQSGDVATQKRELRLYKNREAAKECRRKKKEYVHCLENRVAVLEAQNRTLIEELKQLKDLYCNHAD